MNEKFNYLNAKMKFIGEPFHGDDKERKLKYGFNLNIVRLTIEFCDIEAISLNGQPNENCEWNQRTVKNC